VLGDDPALTFSSIAPLPPAIDELMFAGFLRKKPVELVPAKTVDIKVPANAEIVIEGYINPGERCLEGPFGDHTGYYSLADYYPVFHVTAITHRAKPVYPATIVGIPPMEDGWMGKAVERLFLPLVRLTVPEIVDMNLPVEGVFHNFCFVSIRKRYPGHAFKVMNAIWGLGQLMFSKFIVVFDADVNVHDLGEVIWRLGANVDPERDTLIVKGPVDVLDHASPYVGYGSKIGFDATTKWKEEGFTREWPDVIRMSSAQALRSRPTRCRPTATACTSTTMCRLYPTNKHYQHAQPPLCLPRFRTRSLYHLQYLRLVLAQYVGVKLGFLLQHSTRCLYISLHDCQLYQLL
jgi:4-hydroxy-3-polyprenylbenzoate decarboxylase